MPFKLLSEKVAANYTAGLLGTFDIDADTSPGLYFFGTEAEAADAGVSPDFYFQKTEFCGKIVALTDVTFDAESVVVFGDVPAEDATLLADAEKFGPFQAIDLKSGTLRCYTIPKGLA